MVTRDRDVLIEPRRGRREALLPGRAIFLVNPAEARQGFEMLENDRWSERSFYNSRLMVNKSHGFCVVGPALGAPAAGLILEKLIALGVREIFLLSCCGVIDPAFTVGDMILGTRAISGVGLSHYYDASPEMTPSAETMAFFRTMLLSNTFDFREGVIWSTDAPYRERRSELILLQEEFGICGVDMEYAALLSIATHRSVNLAGLFVVSDILWSPEWQPGFTGRHFRQCCEQVIGSVISHLSSRGEG